MKVITKLTVRLGLVAVLMLSLSACEGEGNVLYGHEIPLPTDSDIVFYCENEGIADEQCALDDYYNPFARVAVNDETKWDLYNTSPSAKASFYLWATAQARRQGGENQYYTGSSLHEVYTEARNERVKEQALKAYRSMLDNYFDSETTLLNGNQQLLRIWVGNDLYRGGSGKTFLFASKAEALATIVSWGYTYDTSTGDFTRN